MAFFQNLWAELVSEFTATFIAEQRYLLFLNGLKTTLIVAFGAAAMGVVLGFVIAYIRTTHDHTGHLRILNALCKLYLTVIRGTPTMIQLLIMYFIIFGSVKIDKVPVAVLAFGINSGAYVAEIFRSGIMSIPPGQMEAARSLGLNYTQATWKIILPQAVKNVLPALGNEVIVLLAGPDQGRRHRPQPHLQPLLPLHLGGADVSGAGAGTGKDFGLSGREAGAQ